MLKVSFESMTARVARLATASAAGQPHCVPVCFVFCGDQFVIALDEKPKRVEVLRLKRVRNILENPQVSLVIDHYEEDWSRLNFVMIEGRAQLRALTEVELSSLRGKYPQYESMQLHWGVVIEPIKWVSWAA